VLHYYENDGFIQLIVIVLYAIRCVVLMLLFARVVVARMAGSEVAVKPPVHFF